MSAGSAESRPSLSNAYQILLKNEAPHFRQATETLFKVIQNIIAHPEDPAFQKLRRSTATFTTKIAPAVGAVRFLRAVGFTEEGDGDQASLTLLHIDLKLLEEGKLALKACVKEYARMQEELRRIENAAAAEKLAQLRDISKQNTAQRDQEQAAELLRQRELLKIDREDYVRQRDPTVLK